MTVVFHNHLESFVNSFKDDFANQRTSANAMRSLLRQLLLQRRGLADSAALQKLAEDGMLFTESFKELSSTFTSLATNVGEVTCVLDALDKCQDHSRAELIKATFRLSRDLNGTGKTKFLVTSRSYAAILREFQEVEKISRETGLARARVEKISTEKALEAEEWIFL